MTFNAKIYEDGTHAVVEVPQSITDEMKPENGYIQVSGMINNHKFKQTLVPVKDSPYRLYVNTPMLEGAEVKVGDVAEFTLRQETRKKKDYAMSSLLLDELKANDLEREFNALPNSKQKDILKYLSGVKTIETLKKNVDKVISQLIQNRLQ